MKSDLIKSLKVTLSFCLFLSAGYVGILWLIAWIAGPSAGSVETVALKEKEVGALLVGQEFTRNDLFWGRPSAVNYNAALSGGSNAAPTNREYLAQVKGRLTAFLKAHPYLAPGDVPSELVTASGSGLDPHISTKAARIQINRIAATRNIPSEKLYWLVDSLKEKTLFGPEVVNVLRLNVALLRLEKQQ